MSDHRRIAVVMADEERIEELKEETTGNEEVVELSGADRDKFYEILEEQKTRTQNQTSDPFPYEQKEPGDLIKSADWNRAMAEIARLGITFYPLIGMLKNLKLIFGRITYHEEEAKGDGYSLKRINDSTFKIDFDSRFNDKPIVYGSIGYDDFFLDNKSEEDSPIAIEIIHKAPVLMIWNVNSEMFKVAITNVGTELRKKLSISFISLGKR